MLNLLNVLGLLITVLLYLLPTIISFRRNLPNAKKIFLINFFLGWTVYGWFAALIMASRGKGQWMVALGSFLLVVVLLAVIAIPGLLSAKRFRQNEVAKANLKNLSEVLENYAKEHRGEYPHNTAAFKSLELREYVKDICNKNTAGHNYRCDLSSYKYHIVASAKPGWEGYSTFTMQTGGVLTEERPARPE